MKIPKYFERIELQKILIKPDVILKFHCMLNGTVKIVEIVFP